MRIPLIGAHTSVAGGVEMAPPLAQRLGYCAIQIFVRNRTAWRTPPMGEGQPERFRRAVEACGVRAAMAHNSYLINLCSARDDVREMSMPAMREELARCRLLGVPDLVIHPGAPGDRGEAWGIETIADALSELLAEPDGEPTRVLLETTAGQGRSVGRRFEHLAEIIRLVGDHQQIVGRKRVGAGKPTDDRIGVCLDTCHVFAAGYDLRSPVAYARTIDEFDRVIGLDRLGAIHLNDSRRPLGSRVDRHAHIGKGYLGVGAFRSLLNDPRLHQVPMVLETPKSADCHEDIEALALLRQQIDW